MTTYSHSKISTYENCPYQYKLHYIDKVKVDIPTTIEPFMGDIVHQTLEKLYKDKKFHKINSKAMLVKFFKELWEKEYSEDILIVKEDFTTENYKKMGIKFIEDYYDRMNPFEQITILGLETQDRMTLPDGNQWHVRIDKLGCDDKENYYVCDYKTNSRMKYQDEADEDRQLALYSVWVKNKFSDVKSVKLVWHMLAFNKDAISERTDEQLERLQEDVTNIIKEIEIATKEDNFPRKQSGLCSYCVYKEQCPSFKHEFEIENIKTIKRFKENEGVKLVDEFSEIKAKIAELEEKGEKFKLDLIQYSKEFGIDIVYGSNKKCPIKEFDKIVLPGDEIEKAQFIQLIKDKGLYEECSMICYPKLNSKILKNEMGKEIKSYVDIVKDFRLSLSKRKDIEE